MIEKFKNKILQLIDKNDKLLLTVSGGSDSVAMTDLFAKAGLRFDIAHCNFKLRGTDADEDAVFVRKLAQKYNAKFHLLECPAVHFAEKKGISIEMAARELRYAWFASLARKYSYTKIATAHNLNDSVETILLNLAHKTGLKGLTGIPEINNLYIRPLLGFAKDEILDYCKRNNLDYRIDKTNFQTVYQRNKIRHLIIPEFEKINPAFLQNVIETASNLRQYAAFFDIHFKKFKQECIINEKQLIFIKQECLKNYFPQELFLFEFLKNYGFNRNHILNILDNLKTTESAEFMSDTYSVVISRNEIVLFAKQFFDDRNKIYEINLNQFGQITISKGNYDEIKISLELFDAKNYRIEKKRQIAQLDFDKLTFPLILRKWKKGDYFYPYGMKGKKKISDYFNDNKFSFVEKNKTWILESDGQIVWIVNHRLDKRFALTNSTKKILRIMTF